VGNRRRARRQRRLRAGLVPPRVIVHPGRVALAKAVAFI
jgi:hypothetical protein